MQKVTVLGATGSIGLNTLDVIRDNPERFSVFALTANTQVKLLAKLCAEFKPEYAVVLVDSAAIQLQSLLKAQNLKTVVLCGEQALIDVVEDQNVDTVMAAIVGAAGLRPCLAAAKSGKRILLANKESLVMSGQLFLQEVKDNQATLLPVDSEHNAIFQSLPLDYQSNYLQQKVEDFGVSQIVLTGSGGPFRTTPLELLSAKSADEACAHPNWDMGRKISVDSATMMNKGLEFIEACYLFSVTPDFIDVLIHPQSVIHSMVRYIDGSVVAQMGQPDMRTPIAHTLGFPDRIKSSVSAYDFTQGGDFTFNAPCEQRYPNLYLAKQAFNLGQESTTTLNAANEVAVDAFLQGKIAFTDIASLNADVLAAITLAKAHSIDDILAIDNESRSLTQSLISKRY
nr:1-deoxy-D-xylulose-5-phosphate reductoisomerase [Algibacillus agarilyticus]